jgi:TP901 family phage tail tape measure protein
MANGEDNLNISANLEDNVSDGIKKIGKSLNDLQKPADNLTKALKKTGIAALNSFNKLDVKTINQEFAKLTTGEITKLSTLLKEAGISLSQFLSGEKIMDPDIGLAINSAVSDLNELQAKFGEPLSLRTDFKSLEDVFAASRNLLRKTRAEVRQFYAELTDDSVAAQTARQFEPIYELRRTLTGGALGSFDELISFERVQGEADQLVDRVESLRQSLIEVGKAASTGNEDAIAEFLQLKKTLDAAQESSKDLNRQLQNAADSAQKSLGGPNASLRALGFDEIKLEDIFPSREQQKIANIQRKIDQAVRDSVQEGAVKRTLNFFLAQDRQIESVDKNVVALTSHLPRLRYALYDVSNTATIFGAAIVGAIGATVKLAADYERSFADVRRTTGLAGAEAEELRRSLVNLSQDIPVSFADLADIATLAGQLNVANEVVDDFTNTVAQFSATTDVTIESAATSFGRLDQLVDGVNGQFEKLGSSILKVGVNAVATESDIIAISTQIASVANIAGFSAAELIGLSSALASVGTRPELARGTFTRLFTEIQQSVGEGGDQLRVFANVAGQSVEEFVNAWTAGDGADQVVAILEGLNAAGTDADRVLAQLGITSVRDVPTLLKLAQGVESVKDQISLAKIGFEEGTELQEQYGIITETLAEKLEVLKNNLSAVVAAFGTLSGPLGIAVDGLNTLLRALEFVLQNPIGKFIAGTAAAFGLLVGVSALSIGAMARFGGSLAGAGTASIELFETIGLTRIQIDQLTASTTTSTSAQLRKNAATTQAAAAEAKSAVATKRSELAVKSKTISTIRFNTSLSALRLRLTSASASLSAYAARVRLAGSAALFAAKQTKAYGLAVKSLKAATGVGAFLVITSAIEFLIGKMGELNDETKTAEERFENWGSILEAVRQDSIDFANATEDNIDQFTIIGRSVQGAGEEVGNYSRIVAAATGNEKDLARVLNNSADAFDAQTIAIGKNTRAILAQKLAKELAAAVEPSDFEEFIFAGLQSVRQVFSLGFAPDIEISQKFSADKRALDTLIQTIGTDLGEALAQSGFDFGEWTRLVASGSIDAANALAKELKPAAEAVLKELQESGRGSAAEIQALEQIISADLQGTLNEFVQSGSEINSLLRATQIELAITGELFQEFEEEADGASVAADSFKDTLGEIVDAYFGPINAQREMEESIRALGEVFFNEGAQIATTSQEMQEAITAVIGTASSPEEAVEGLAGFFRAIVDGGYASEEQLSILQSVIVDTYETAVAAQMESLKQAEAAIKTSIALARISPRGGGARARSEALAENRAQQAALEDSLAIVQNINTANGNAAKSAGLLAEGYNDARKAASGAKDEVEQIEETTEQAVRTLLDYASDLDNVFNRAFGIRFGGQSAIDDITEAWENFTEQVADATQSLEELIATQQDLAADRAIKEYFLSVAESYGDQLRAAKLRAEIAELDNESAEAARELAEAQETAAGATALTGDGAGARQNRQALLGLVRNYQDYIAVLAESGAGQDELRRATEEARAEFVQQAIELGFAEQDVLMYAEAFDDVRTAIDRVPRDVTIDFNADPALQALNELNAKLDQSIEKAKELNRQQRIEPPAARQQQQQQPVTGSGTPLLSAGRFPVRPSGPVDSLLFRPQTVEIRPQTVEIRNPRQVDLGTSEINTGFGFAGGQYGFSSGGFTGSGGKYQPAGIVHRGEYVVPKQYVNQSSGLPNAQFLAQLQNGMRGYAQGGFVGGGMGDGAMMVELSPYDRKLLQDAGNVQLRVNGRILAETTNTSNYNEARRGSN